MKETEHVIKLAGYFLRNIEKGYNPDALKWALVNQGYQKTSVEKALELAHQEMARKAPVFKEKPTITREVIDEAGKPVDVKKSWFRRLFGI